MKILIQILSFLIFTESHELVLQAACGNVEFKGCWIQCDISFSQELTGFAACPF